MRAVINLPAVLLRSEAGTVRYGNRARKGNHADNHTACPDCPSPNRQLRNMPMRLP